MNRFYKLLGFAVAFMIGDYALAASPPETNNTDAPPAMVDIYSQLSPKAELIYHILVAEVAIKRTQLETALQHYRLASITSDDPRVAERAAGIALFIKDNAALLDIAQRWLTLDSDNIKAHQAMALALLHNDRTDAAMEHLEALRLAAKDGQEGFSALNGLLDQLQDKQQLFRVMENLRERHPQSRFAHYYYVLAALNVAEYQKALEQLDTLLAEHPQWAQAHLLRTQVMVEKGDTDAALKGLAEAVSALPKNQALRTGYARLLVNAGRLQEARDQFQHLIGHNPKDANSLYALGLLAAEEEQYDEAVSHLMAVLQLGVRVLEAYYELGKIEEQREDYQKAREWYERVVEGSERYLYAQVRIGALLARQENFEAMGVHFAVLRQNNSGNQVALYVSEAEILRESGRYRQAFELLDQALGLEQNADNKELLYARALAAEKIDRLDVLEQDLKTLIEQDPEHAHALNALGYTLADRTDRYQEAYDYLERAIELLPEDAAVLDSMGWIHYRLGDYEKSLEYLRSAYERHTDAEIAAHLSEVLWVSGQQDEARQIWQQALEKEPESAHLRKVKERLGW